MSTSLYKVDRGVWVAPERLSAPQVRVLAQRVEQLGYSTLWVGETFGRDPFAQLAAIGAATETLLLATGIANIYSRHPAVMQQAANTIAEQTNGRMILGLGVSSPIIVEKVRGLRYHKPLTYLREYLAAMDQARYSAVAPPQKVPRVLAALGPKMLELAAQRSSGAHPYNTTPEHTAWARSIIGEQAGLFVEQKVLLTENKTVAHATAAKVLKFYVAAPGYRNAWRKMGFSEDDIEGLSPKFLDGLVVWGDVDAIEARLSEHAQAGASHICIHPLHPQEGQGAVDDAALLALAPSPNLL